MADEAAGDDRHEEEEGFETDSDLADGDQVIARGWPRNYQNLAKHGFRPVWTKWDGYPEEQIPEDIMEFLDERGKCPYVSVVGPLRSLAWLAGLDELVEAIDHSAYVITDSIEQVPLGTTLMFPVERHIEEGTIPPRIADKVLGYHTSRTAFQRALTVRDECPEGITGQLAPFNPKLICGASRLERPSGCVNCIKIGAGYSLTRLAARLRWLVGRPLQSENLWFRGMTISAVRSTLAFFIPEINCSNRDKEFGPGFYTTDSLEHALGFVHRGGAVMVFRDPVPDPGKARIWEPSLDEWNSWVARWSGLKAEIRKIPAECLEAAFIKGPISMRHANARGSDLPVQSGATQLVAISYEGCQVLSDSLDMIIFVDGS